ncbi:hypothetical protein ACWGKA_30645 [Streptomyces luteogriseus]
MTDQTAPSRRAELHDEIVKALGLIKTVPPVAHRREQADHVLAVLYREWPWLRAEAEETAVLPVPTDRAAVERVRAVLETEAVVGRSALEYRGLITSALLADEAQPAVEARCTCVDAGPAFAPAGHYADCPAADEAQQDGAQS